MEVLNRVKGALMVERIPANIRATARMGIAHGPLKMIVEGSDLVWNTNAQRVDNVAGTKLASGGPL